MITFILVLGCIISMVLVGEIIINIGFYKLLVMVYVYWITCIFFCVNKFWLDDANIIKIMVVLIIFFIYLVDILISG